MLAATTVLCILILTPGVFVTLHALSTYPLLDARPVMGLLIAGFLLSAFLLVWSIVSERSGSARARMRAASVVASFGLILLGLAMLMNGGLDQAPSDTIRATVLEKTVLEGRYGHQYQLRVSPFKGATAPQELSVASSDFDHAVVGSPVTFQLHKGFFGLPWYGRTYTP